MTSGPRPAVVGDAGAEATAASPVPAAQRRSRRAVRPGLVAAWAVGLVIVLAGLWPALLTTHSPDAVDPLHALTGPSGRHLFGTDQLGRDIYSRVIYGARQSLMIGFGATGISVVLGSVLGLLATAGGRMADEVVMRVTDVFLAFPGLLLALLVVAVLGGGTANATLAIGLSTAPGFTRLIRGQILVITASDYIPAALMLGRPRFEVFVRHALPNALPPALALATVQIGTAIIGGSSLSFLGLGPKPPTPEWGAMISDGRDLLAVAWPIAVFPGLAITATVIAFNLIGQDLRRRFEGSRPDGRG